MQAVVDRWRELKISRPNQKGILKIFLQFRQQMSTHTQKAKALGKKMFFVIDRLVDNLDERLNS